MSRLNLADPSFVQQALQGAWGGSMAMEVATAVANIEQNPPQSAVRRMFDPYYRCIGEINDHIELQLKDGRQILPAGHLSLKATDPLADTAILCESTVVPVIYDKGGYRWSGRIDVAHDQFKDGKRTVECELIGDKHWLDRILCWPNPFLPIWVQDPSEWFGMGPGLTVISTLLQEQAWRVQSGWMEIINDIGSLDLNLQGWFQELQADLASVGQGLTLTDVLQAVYTPICVVPVNPITDTSAWIEINGRMDTCWKLIQQQLLDNGFDVTAVMWLPGEPQPEGLLFPLTKPTVVVRVVDRSGFTGPWGPFEGVLVDATQLEGSVEGNALAPLLDPNNTQPYVQTDLGEYLAPTIGVDFVTPWVMLDLDVDRSGIIEYSVDHHHPLAWQVVTGGQSPKVHALSGN